MSRRTTFLPLTTLRARLSAVAHGIDRLGAVAVTVRGEVCAWLVPPKRFGATAGATRPPPRPIRGPLTIQGNLDEGSAQAAEGWLAMAGARP